MYVCMCVYVCVCVCVWQCVSVCMLKGSSHERLADIEKNIKLCHKLCIEAKQQVRLDMIINMPTLLFKGCMYMCIHMYLRACVYIP
jgi:hypothetical protein